MTDVKSVSRDARREIDALIAEKVFGLVRCQGKKHDADYPNTYCYAEPASPEEGAEARCYSTEISDAWQVVEKMLALGFTLLLHGGKHVDWYARFNATGVQWTGHGATAPSAICRAALRAVSNLPTEDIACFGPTTAETPQ